MYSITNQDFVRGTVSNFYELYGVNDTVLSSFVVSQNENRVCPADDEELAMATRNEGFTQVVFAVIMEG